MTKTNTFQVLSDGRLLGSCKAQTLQQANARLLQYINTARVGQPITGSHDDLSQIIKYEVRENGLTFIESYACAPVRPITLDAPPTLVTA